MPYVILTGNLIPLKNGSHPPWRVIISGLKGNLIKTEHFQRYGRANFILMISSLQHLN